MTEDERRVIDRLARKAVAGDKAAEELLMRQLRGLLMTLMVRRYGRSVGEDFCQECCLKVLSELRKHRWNPARPFLPWAFAVARNRALDLGRAERRRARSVVDVDDLPDEAYDDDLERLDLASELPAFRRCWQSLEPALREVLVLSYVCGYTHEEISRELNRPRGTVGTWIREGRNRLRDYREAEEAEIAARERRKRR
jgi:RNA polymerase sigma-70 factor, ECF subfamily